MTMGAQRVFVYGTLLRGEANHHYLRDAQFLGAATTPPCCRLYSLGAYPVLCLDGSQRVQGEVYRVSQHVMRRLDVLEEYPQYYQRKLIDTAHGRAWVYYQQRRPEKARVLASGNWRSRGVFSG